MKISGRSFILGAGGSKKDSMDIRAILFFFVTVQLLLLCIFLVSNGKKRRKSHIFLAILLFAKAMRFLNGFLESMDFQTVHVYFLLVPFSYLFGPALFFYAKSLTARDFSPKKGDAIHLLPFVISSLYFAWIYHFRTLQTKWEILDSYRTEGATVAVLMIIALHFQIFGYFVASFRTLARHRREVREAYSSLDKVNLTWLQLVLYGFLVIWALSILAFILDRAALNSALPYSLVIVLDFVFVNLIAFMGLRQPEIFYGGQEAPKYNGAPLTRDEYEHYKQALDAYMESAKPHLDPALTLAQLARRLSIPPRRLSQVINEFLGMSFFSFINSHRVEVAKHLLAGGNGRKNILEVLLEAGFSSKSAFNRVFKEIVGMTPSEFRRKHVRPA